MKSELIPKSTRFFPNKSTRLFHVERNAQFGPEKFQTYNDWFYFIHVDPVIRWWHAIGMVIGMIFYIFAGIDIWIFGLSWSVVFKILTGVFFFYFLPLLSHFIYDGGGAKLSPNKFHSTLIPVIHINLMTLTWQYDSWLRKFIEKYPFTTTAWNLEEKKLPFVRQRN
jgi:hypothetical protein